MSTKNMNPKEKTLHRLKIVRGHLNKVIEMVEADRYCIDVIHQSQAIQSALRQIDNIVLEKHLQTCAVEHVKQGTTKESVEEIMKVFKKAQA
ncbi:MAG: metal-sensing transcriptional repressor [bacterium]|nr:metal-sensing transcriptional repressor [bacterium]